MNFSEVLFWLVFGSVPVGLVAALLYSLVRPDRKPPIGAYESYAARVENMEEHVWGRLSLKDQALTFTPHGRPSVSVPLSEVTVAEFEWFSLRFTVRFGTQVWHFVAANRKSIGSAHVGGADGRRARKEWQRQFRAAGIRIEPEASEREQWKRSGT
ncbi:MAG: hypothetical protein AB7N24_04065 [Dehalococcoidia bacterium]